MDQHEVGFFTGISNDDYHAGPGISKSGLWTIYTQTPAHYKYPPEKAEKTTAQQGTLDFGSASHCAILEPEEFENRYVRGPEDRKGNKWKDLVEGVALSGKTVIVQKDYDNVLAIRDRVHADSWLNGIITGGKPIVEGSAYWIDPATGCLCRCRPDLYRADLKVMVDCKSTRSAHPSDFARSVANFGYHAQEAFYADGMNTIGQPVAATVFIAWEKESPYATAVYELPPSIVEEGRATMRKALNIYAACVKDESWPAYPEGVQELKFKRYHFMETEAPDFADGELA